MIVMIAMMTSFVGALVAAWPHVGLTSAWALCAAGQGVLLMDTAGERTLPEGVVVSVAQRTRAQPHTHTCPELKAGYRSEGVAFIHV